MDRECNIRLQMQKDYIGLFFRYNHLKLIQNYKDKAYFDAYYVEIKKKYTNLRDVHEILLMKKA